MEAFMDDEFFLGERTRVVPVLVLLGLRAGAFHQENSHCQTYFGVSDGGGAGLSFPQLLDVHLGESTAHESEQCLHGCVLLQLGAHMAMAHRPHGTTYNVDSLYGLDSGVCGAECAVAW